MQKYVNKGKSEILDNQTFYKSKGSQQRYRCIYYDKERCESRNLKNVLFMKIIQFKLNNTDNNADRYVL